LSDLFNDDQEIEDSRVTIKWPMRPDSSIGEPLPPLETVDFSEIDRKEVCDCQVEIGCAGCPSLERSLPISLTATAVKRHRHSIFDVPGLKVEILGNQVWKYRTHAILTALIRTQ
jgi:hypothetical protein